MFFFILLSINIAMLSITLEIYSDANGIGLDFVCVFFYQRSDFLLDRVGVVHNGGAVYREIMFTRPAAKVDTIFWGPSRATCDDACVVKGGWEGAYP